MISSAPEKARPVPLVMSPGIWSKRGETKVGIPTKLLITQSSNLFTSVATLPLRMLTERLSFLIIFYK